MLVVQAGLGHVVNICHLRCLGFRVQHIGSKRRGTISEIRALVSCTLA